VTTATTGGDDCSKWGRRLLEAAEIFYILVLFLLHTEIIFAIFVSYEKTIFYNHFGGLLQ
jgi:hypothetical protein